MNKRFLFGMFATVAMLMTTSCQNDEFDAIEAGNESIVSFTLEQPGIASRAYSDGTTATTLTYAVYEAGTKTIVSQSEDEVKFVNKTATVNIRLVTGKSYDIIFWADAENAPYTFSASDQTITVDYNNVASQDENRDAFFAAKKELLVNGSINETITLYRPFAQLNIGTTDADEDAVKNYNPTQSSVTVKNVYNTLNLLDGIVSNETELTYAMANIPGEEEVFPVAGVKYLSMNYLLVANEKELVDVKFTASNGSHNISRDYTAVPVQRNYRTNIYGKLLTDAADFNITINPEYGGGSNINHIHSTKASFKEDLKNISASTASDVIIVLDEDVEFETLGTNGNSYLLTRAGVNLTIEGNGHTITAIGDGIASVCASENGSLTIKNATIADNSVSYAEDYWEEGYLELGGVLVLENCNIVNAIQFKGSSLIVDDCDFNSNKDSEYALWIYDGTAEVKNSYFSGARAIKICDYYTGADVTSVIIDNCTFENLTKKPGVAIDEKQGTTMTVTIKNSTFINTQPGDQNNYIYETDNVVPTLENNTVGPILAEELNNATLENGTVVVLSEGNFNIPNSVAGKTITFSSLGDAEKTVINPHGGFSDATLAFEYVTIAVAADAYYTGSQSIAGATYKNCIIEGQLFLYGPSTFENCTFNNTDNNYNVWTYGTSSNFIGCTFNCDAKAVLIYTEGAVTAEYTFDNCTFNDSGKLNELKAAIEIGESAYENEANYTVRINKCTVNGFSKTGKDGAVLPGDECGTEVWGNKNSIPADRLHIWIDGTHVY